MWVTGRKIQLKWRRKLRELRQFTVIVHINDQVRIKKCRAIPPGVECDGFIAGRIALKGDPFALASAIGVIRSEAVSFVGCVVKYTGPKAATQLRIFGSKLPSRPIVDGYFDEDAYHSYQVQDEEPKFL